ncbi:MAG: hypothetical protein H6713_33060 [Myxococcales bacterium]|nr:hypothetical protein [Myxococcales bacterium]
MGVNSSSRRRRRSARRGVGTSGVAEAVAEFVIGRSIWGEGEGRRRLRRRGRRRRGLKRRGRRRRGLKKRCGTT